MKTCLRCVVWAAVAATAVVLVGAGRAADEPKAKAKDKEKEKAPPKKLTVMERKLMHSQRVLEGLALNDFARIGSGADGLMECAKDVTWKINETEKYLMHTNEFLRRSEALKKAAKDKNTDAAALAYVDLTLTCVRCHQHLREERISSLPLPVLPRAVAANE
jgi:cytochrome c556